ncbi:hypothetical protein L3X38_012924 [Prunus dulcis]|uniref:Leucine-rich repeat-containing N-terminal plant-type domain-containing protein n=1 Tax=Prunus dulcis TaxID=3755 RepID=A0AAD4WMZ8_PRUDU|nr:hypothetical protein L3X38_012924 [Prunus dulcis]
MVEWFLLLFGSLLCLTAPCSPLSLVSENANSSSSHHAMMRKALLCCNSNEVFFLDASASLYAGAYPKLLSWKPAEGANSSCCSWDGVECDASRKKLRLN